MLQEITSAVTLAALFVIGLIVSIPFVRGAREFFTWFFNPLRSPKIRR